MPSLRPTRGIAGRSATDTIGQRMRLARERAGLTLEFMAGKLGIRPELLKNFETDRKPVATNELHVMADHYKVEYMWLAIGDQTTKDRWPRWWTPPP